MKKIRYILLIMVMLLLPITVQANVPYNTYTGTSEGGVIRTSDAYIPTIQIKSVIGKNQEGFDEEYYFDRLTDVFYDPMTGNLYICDSGLGKLFVLDENYNYVSEIDAQVGDQYIGFNSLYVTENEIYIVDTMNANINVFNKFVNANGKHDYIKTIGTPTNSPLFQGKDAYMFLPISVVVDKNSNIYVNSDASENGLIMLNSDGDFVTFFGGNPIRENLLTGIRSMFMTEQQKEKLEKPELDVISDVAIDQKGFIYTITSSLKKGAIKKFNVSGKNYFEQNFTNVKNFNSIAIGKYDNVFAIGPHGQILEYERDGNLLFFFGGGDVNPSRKGILNLPSSIAVNNSDQIIVSDQGLKLIQIFDPTPFAKTIHEALDNYQNGRYEESKDLWETTLQYNSMFDLARNGLAKGHMRNENYDSSFNQFELAGNQDGMSESFVEIRQVWLENNLGIVFYILFFITVFSIINSVINKRIGHIDKLKSKLSNLRKVRVFDELLYVFTFLKHPFDGYYELKCRNKSSILSATILYGMLAASYIFYLIFVNEIFVTTANMDVVTNITTILIIFILLLVSNNLVCQINEGEGTLENAYITTAYAFSPIILILPIATIISNGISLNESVFFYLPQAIMFLWVVFLLFFLIKDIHNYGVGETIIIIFKTIFTMAIIGVFIFVLYSLFNTLSELIVDIIREVILR